MNPIFYLLAVLLAACVWALVAPPLCAERKGRASAVLTSAHSIEAVKRLEELPPDSLSYRLLASGCTWQPTTFRIVVTAAGVGVVLFSWAFLPGIPALVAGALAGTIPHTYLKERIKGRGREVDRLLPVAIGRLSAGLLAGGTVADVLEEVGKSLEAEKGNVLGPELRLTAVELRSKDRAQALRDLAARSPSLSLANLAFLLEGYLEVGGGKYTRILVETASQVQRILAARNRTRAKAGDAMLSAKVIPAVLVLVIAYLSRDGMIRASLSSLPVQFVLGVTIALMVFGYFIMRSMVSEAA